MLINLNLIENKSLFEIFETPIEFIELFKIKEFSKINLNVFSKKDLKNNNLFHYLFLFDYPENFINFIKTKINKKIKILANSSNDNGNSPLFLLLLNSSNSSILFYETFEIKNLNVLNNQKMSLLDAVLWSKNYKNFMFFIDKINSEHCNNKDEMMNRPIEIILNLFVGTEKNNALKKILSIGGEPNNINPINKQTAMHLAGELEDLKSYEILESFGGDSEILDFRNESPQDKLSKEKSVKYIEAIYNNWKFKFQKIKQLF